MPVFLIVLGLIFIIGGVILKKYQKHSQTSNTRDDFWKVSLDRNYDKHEEKLLKHSKKLDRLLDEIDRKERKLYSYIKNIDKSLDKPLDKSVDKPATKEYYHQNKDFKKQLDSSIEQFNKNKISYNKVVPDKYRKILNLNARGYGSEEIARRLDIGVRETELILKLYTRKADSIVN